MIASITIYTTRNIANINPVIIRNLPFEYASSWVKVTCSYNAHHFLTFETKEKAEFFLKEKINLIVDLSNAGFL
jgi:hypothetical protein